MPVKIFALPRRLGFTFRVMLFCLFAGLHRSHTTDLHRMKGCSMSQRKTHWILGRSSISPFIIGKNSILLHRIWQKFWLSECISRCNVIFLYILLSLTSSSSSCRFTVLGALKFWLHVMEKQSIDFVNTIKVLIKIQRATFSPYGPALLIHEALCSVGYKWRRAQKVTEALTDNQLCAVVKWWGEDFDSLFFNLLFSLSLERKVV